MKHKSFIIFLYGIALYIVVSRWYKVGNSGLPDPQVIAAPSYLYGVLALSSDFLEGLPVVLAAGLTLGLWYAIHPQLAKTSTNPVPTTGVPLNMAGKPVPQTRSVKASG